MPDIDPSDLEALMAAMQQQAVAPEVGPLSDEHPEVVRALRPLNPIRTAATFAGLLTQKGLQSNCVRLETLVHLCIAHCQGTKSAPAALIAQVFRALGSGRCGRAEDPAEDVFVSNVVSGEGNFRVLEGVWESAGFFLQRVLNVTRTLPDQEPFRRLRASVHALLKLSDAVCERASLRRYERGNAIPEGAIPSKIMDRLAAGRRHIRFSMKDLHDIGVEKELLAPFIFDPARRDALREQTISHTDLERRPLAWHDNELVVLLPTAVSAAIRRACIERIGTGPNQKVFTANLAKEYGALFSRTSLLGGGPAPVYFGPGPHGPAASVVWEVDRGRHLQLVFLIDPLDEFEDGGLAGEFQAFGELADPIDEIIDPAYARASQETGFRDGITLLVVGGVGRNISLWLNNKQRANWRVETISAPDLFTLSWTPRMKPLHLWRILAAQDALRQRGIELHNMNGLLNLVAWSRQLAGHLVPHADIPAEWSGEAAGLMIGQNSLLDLRHEVASLWDVHAERDVAGSWIALRREESPLVPEDDRSPVYAPEAIRLTLAACTTSRRTWWCELILPETIEPELAFQRRAMVTTWMRRTALVIEAHLAGLSAGPVLWRCRFEYDRIAAEHDATPMDRSGARETIHVTTDPAARLIEFGVTAGFDAALFNAENVAEQALVEALLDGAWSLAGEDLPAAKREALLKEVVPDTLARQSHIFSARDFRDHIDALQHARVLTISQYDDAYLKIGLGWRVRDLKEGGEVTGKQECIAYLNQLVENLEDELCVELRVFNRRTLVDTLLSNYERAAQQRTWWRRTAAAQLSLHTDKKAVLEAMGRNETKLNGVFQGTRILLEMAVCECPAAGGLLPGDLDLSRLMVHANTLFAIGGWSDAIRWDVMPARLVIRPLGDIHVHADFFDQVLSRFGRATSDQRFTDSAAGYARNLEEREGVPTAEIPELDDFADAWQKEFGFSIDQLRRFLDTIEDRAIGQQKFIMPMRRSECVQVLGEGHPTERIVDLLALTSRPNWREVPEGFRPTDRQPWRFRRRLSVLRRPMLQADDDPDPTLMVAPGLLREAFGYTLQNYYRGDYPDWQLGPAMLAWCGRSRHKRGLEFNAEMATALRALGWQVEPEIKLTKVLRRALDRDYGDIDALAWNPARNRILVIECKDVQYRKTPGEVAEQLSDFRGEILPNGKPDLLRKHLDRVALVKQNGPAACAYMQMPPDARIESHLVFKNPVPMQFVTSRAGQVRISLFDDLMNI